MPRRPSSMLFLAATMLLAGPASLNCVAQGFVEHLEPPVLERGKTTRVTVVGSDLGKALDLWSSLPAGMIKAAPVGTSTSTQALFEVTVAATAPVGVCGLRLATMDGLANTVLVLIDDLPVRPAPAAPAPAATAPAVAAKAALPSALWGRFREAVVDRFNIDVTAGQRVSFEVVGNRLGKDVDPLITLRDASGRFIAEHDNDPGLYFDCRFEHTFAAAGTYQVEVRDARYHGSEHGYYVLRMGRFPAARVAVPVAVRPGQRAELQLPEITGAANLTEVPADLTSGLFYGVLRRPMDEGSVWLPLEATRAEVTVHREPGQTIDDGTPARVPGVLCGVLEKPKEHHFFRLELAKGQKIHVRADTKAFNSPADLELSITDAKGKEQRRATENNREEITLDFTAGNPGIYGLMVRDLNHDGGPAFVYRIEIRPSSAAVTVQADVEGLSVPRGDYQPVPLTVSRTDYAGPIALTLVGATAGVTLIPSEIGPGINTVVCKLSASPDTPLGLHTLQILARPTALPEATPTLVRCLPLIDRQLVNVDLIPHALREDQRRLPPALVDRFALQVLPPAPFTVELPEPLVALARYQAANFPIVTTRRAGFTGPITFSAKGGQLADKEEGRTRLYAVLPEARADRLQVTGSLHSKILTNLTKHRVEVTAVGVHEGRRIALTRTFDLDIQTAFTVKAEPALLKMEPGTAARVHLLVERMKTFDGDVTVQLTPSQGIDMPDKVLIPRGKTAADVEIRVAPDRTPGRHALNLVATAVVSGFEEEQRGGRFEVEVAKTPVSKK